MPARTTDAGAVRLELVPYLAAHADLLGLIKHQRQRHRERQQTEQLVWGIA